MAKSKADLWSYALAVYKREGVPEACLRLQDEFGADVPVLLYTLWMAAHGWQLDPPAMERVEAEIRTWRRDVVVPLRQVRRRLKTGPRPAPDARTETLRSAIKGAELSAEKIELETLSRIAFIPTQSARAKSPYQENLDLAIALYSGGRSVPEHLPATLLDAAREVAEEDA
ncbi:MAG: TIGR02444 family protein [Paracoccaceae bacterium]